MENELNKWIHRFLGRCTNPDLNCDCTPLDYCNDLNLASLVEAKAIELKGTKKYVTELHYVVTNQFRDNPDIHEEAYLLITATALQRCTAARAAVEGK